MNSKLRGGGRAFTLLEILLVLVAIGILGSVVVGGFTNVVPAGKEAAACNKARIVNAGRIAFALTTPDAPEQWAAAATDGERSALLTTAGVLTGTAADWLSSSGGYTLSFAGGLRDKTILRGKNGELLLYSD